MGAELEVKGMPELVEKVQEMGQKGNRIQNQALLKAAQPVLDDMVQTVAFRDRTGKLRRMLKVSRPKSKNNTKYVLVGIDKGDISEVFYGKFIEFGTSREPAKPFMQPAYERHKKEAVEIIADELRKALKL